MFFSLSNHMIGKRLFAEEICRTFALQNRDDVTQAIRSGSCDSLVSIALRAIGWTPAHFNLFVEGANPPSPNAWVWGGRYWYLREVRALLSDLILMMGGAVAVNIERVSVLAKLGSHPLGLYHSWSYLQRGRQSLLFRQIRNQHPGYIYTTEGMLNLLRGVNGLEPHRAGFWNAFDTLSIDDDALRFDPKTATPFPHERIREMCGYDDDEVQRLRWLLGAALFGDPNINKVFLWCHGVSDTGKSFLLELLRTGLDMYVTIGDNNTMNRASNQAVTSGTDLVALQGKRIVLYDEMHGIKNTALVKSLMSGAEISARELRQRQSPPVRYTATPVFLSNVMLTSPDEALMEKMRLIQFTTR